jgi:hypothetical protein
MMAITTNNSITVKLRFRNERMNVAMKRLLTQAAEATELSKSCLAVFSRHSEMRATAACRGSHSQSLDAGHLAALSRFAGDADQAVVGNFARLLGSGGQESRADVEAGGSDATAAGPVEELTTSARCEHG